MEATLTVDFFILLAALLLIRVLLRFFRINDPYRLLGLLVLLIALSLPFFINPAAITTQELRSMLVGNAIRSGHLIYAELFDSTPPVASLFFALTEGVFGRSLGGYHSLALIILFFQASFFGILLINNKAYTDSSYVPSLVFALLCFFSFDMISLSSELLASTILLLGLNNLFKEIEFKIQRDEIILNLGVYLGIASLIVFSYLIFFFATLTILIIFTRMGIRKFLLLLFGFALPHTLLWALYFYKGEAGLLWQNFYSPNLTVSSEHLMTAKSLFYLCLIPLVYFVFSLFMLNREARFTKYQSQLFQVMFLWMLFAFVQVFISRELTPHSFIIFIPSLAYFISHYLLLIRRKWIAETMLWIFIIGLLSVNLLSKAGQLKRIDYARLFPKEDVHSSQVKSKKILVLKEGLALYKENTLAGYFLDWKLAGEVFRHPEYYENVVMVEKSLRENPPDIIVDPEDLMKSYLERIPALRVNYKREGDLYRYQR